MGELEQEETGETLNALCIFSITTGELPIQNAGQGRREFTFFQEEFSWFLFLALTATVLCEVQ